MAARRDTATNRSCRPGGRSHRGAVVLCAALLLSCGAPPVSPAASRPTNPSPVASPSATPLTHRPFDTTKLELVHTPIPPLAGRALAFAGMAIDQGAHLLYLADRTASGVHVFDIALPSARYLRTIELASAPAGLAIAEDLHRLFVGLATGTVAVVELGAASPSAVAPQVIDLGGKGRVDQLVYEPTSTRILATSSDDGVVAVIDAARRVFVATLATMQGAVRLGADPTTSTVYLTNPVGRTVWQFDAARFNLRTFQNGPCHGIAVNPATRQALLSCTTPEGQGIQRWDLADGRVIARYDQIGGGDVIIYSVAADRYFIAAPDFERGPAIGIFGGPLVVHVTNVPIPSGSRGVAYDETNQIVYTADLRAGQSGLLSFPLPAGRRP